MAIDFNKPVSTDAYDPLLAMIREMFAGQAKMFEGVSGLSNIPTGAVRINGGLFEYWTGAQWLPKAMGYLRDGVTANEVVAYSVTARSDNGGTSYVPLLVSCNGVSTNVFLQMESSAGYRYLGFGADGTLRWGTSLAASSNAEVWTSATDGVDSGLDADLLDGQEGSYYRDLANATGTLPAARIGATTAYAFSTTCTVGDEPLGPTGIPFDDQNASITLTSAKSGRGLRHNVAAAHTFTIAPQSSGSWPSSGCFAVWCSAGSGDVTVQPGSGVSLRVPGSSVSAARVIAANGYARFVRVNPDTWLMLPA